MPYPCIAEVILLFIAFFVCVGVSVMLAILGGWHIYLISLNKTTIEFYTSRRMARHLKKEGKVFILTIFF